jgi:hypothetical protein
MSITKRLMKHSYVPKTKTRKEKNKNKKSCEKLNKKEKFKVKLLARKGG